MVESHYLISAYIKKGSDLKFKDDRKGNPFCQFEVTGLRKLTEMRLRTSNPVWNERLDIVTDTKPKSALLVCKDFVDTKNHLEVGRAVIALDTLLHDGVDELTIPINRLDVAGTIEGKGEIGLNLNFKRIPSNRHHHFSWTHLLHFDIENIEDLPLYARCIEKGSELVLRVKFGIQQFATQFFDNTESGLDSSGFLFVDDESMRRDDLEFKLVIRRDETEHLIGQGRLAVEALFSDFEEQLKNKVVLTEKLKVGVNLQLAMLQATRNLKIFVISSLWVKFLFEDSPL
ncbi:hypothetical protein MHBO_001675 [Bonamia ostreae]|uniref:C2 domain-containing protein n=1 Tax=Bonamia ostreae TaxID=126728 RepID=A0ABV2AJS4_9EUKA